MAEVDDWTSPTASAPPPVADDWITPSAQPAAQAKAPDDDWITPEAKPKPQDEGMLGSFAREFVHAAPGAALGAGSGLVAGGIGGSIAGLPGTIVGGLVGGVAGGMAGEKISELVQQGVGYNDAAQRAANEEANKWSSAAGRAAAVVLGFGRGAVAPAVRAGSAAIAGGFETGRQLVQEGKISSVPDIAASTVAGAAFAKPYGWGEKLEAAGANIGSRIRPPRIEPPGPIEPAAPPPAQGEFAFGGDQAPLPPKDINAQQPPPDVQAGLFGAEGARLTPAEESRLGQLDQQTGPLTPQEIAEHQGLLRREAGTGPDRVEITPQENARYQELGEKLGRLTPDEKVEYGKLLDRIQSVRTEVPPERAGVSQQGELPLEPGPRLNPETGQYEASQMPSQQRGAAGPTPEPHGSPVAEAVGGVSESPNPPREDSGIGLRPDNKVTEGATEGYSKTKPVTEGGGGVHVGETDPTLQHVFDQEKPKTPPEPPPPEPPTQYGPQLNQQFPQLPPDVAARTARPLEQTERTGVPTPGNTQGVLSEPPVPPGTTRMYSAEGGPRGLFFDSPEAAAKVGPVRYTDVKTGDIGQFKPAAPGEFTTQNPVHTRNSQPLEPIPTQPVAPETRTAPAPADVNTAVAKALEEGKTPPESAQASAKDAQTGAPVAPEPPNQKFGAEAPPDKTGTEPGKVTPEPPVTVAEPPQGGKPGEKPVENPPVAEKPQAEVPPAKEAPSEPESPVKKRLPGEFTGKLDSDISAAEYANRMAEMNANKPSSLKKMFGKSLDEPGNQKAVGDHIQRIKEWNNEYKKVSANQKAALARDNALFQARQEGRAPTAAELHAAGTPMEIPYKINALGQVVKNLKVMDETTFSKALEQHGTREGLMGELTPFVMKMVRKVIGEMPVYTVSAAEMKANGRENTAAYYNRGFDHIVVNEAFLGDKKMMAHAILHEGVHGVTAQALISNVPLKNAVETIMKELRSQEWAAHLSQYGNTGLKFRPGTEYGFTGNAGPMALNAREFIAEAFSNPQFQKMLSEYQLSAKTAKELGDYLGKHSPIQSAWDAIVNTVREFLGVPPNKLNALEAVMRATESAMHENPAAKTKTMGALGLKPEDYSTHIDPLTADEKAVLDRVATPTSASKIPTSLAEVKSTWDKFYTAVKDDLHPLNLLTKALSQGPLAGEKDPYRLARLTRGSYERVEQMLSRGTFDYDTRANTGASLKQVLNPVKNDLEGFTAYATAKRAIELEGRGVTTGVPLPESNRVVAQGAARYEPVFRDLVAFQDRTLEYLQKSGVLSAQDVAQMRAKNKEFVPFHRMMEPDTTPGAGTGGALKVRDPLKVIEGSSREILNPIDTIVRNTNAYVQLAERNRVWQSLEDLAAAHPQGGNFMQRVSHVGASQADTITLYRNGKPVAYKVDPTVARAANSMNADVVNMMTNVLSKPASWLRAGTMLSPELIGKNPIRDQFSAMINSKYGYIPVYDVFRNLGSMFKKDAMYQDWVKAGGANATLVSLDRQAIGMDPKNAMSRVQNVVKSPIEALRIASEFMENITRLGEYRRGIEAGASPAEAAFSSREVTLDFARIGADARVKALNAIIPFFNAQIEGVDRAARAFKDNPIGTLTKVGLGITAPSVMLWFANKSDPRVQELPRWEKDTFWIVPTDKWTNMTATEAGKVADAYKRQGPDGQWQRNTGTIYRIPKPFELGVLFGSIPERALDAYYDKNPQAFKGLGDSLKQALTPGFIPQAINPMIEQFANRSLFTGKTLVPKAMEGVAPKEQATQFTSETAKKLGEMVSQVAPKSSFASPIILENYIKEWTGGLGTHALSLADKALGKSGGPAKPTETMADMPLLKAFTARYPSSNAQSIGDFYDTYTERKQLADTNKALMKSGRAADVEQKTLPTLEGIHKALGEQQKFVRAVYANPTMKSDEKRQLIDLSYEQMIKVAKRGNELFASSGR